MKSLLQLIATFCFTAAAILFAGNNSFAQVQAQDPTEQVQEFSFKIDRLGDARIEVSEKMTQMQWEGFKGGPLVNDPSISKRNMERAMSTYVIEDFKRDIDDMNRTVKMTLKAKAMAQYKGDGNWELKLDTKNPQITKLSDNSIMSISNTVIGGQLTQQIFKVYFPDGCGNIQQSTDSFGKAVFTYQSGEGVFSYFRWNNISGLLLIVAAVIAWLRKPQQVYTLSPDKQLANI